MNTDLIAKIIEAALLAYSKPMPLEQLQSLFDEDERPTREQLDKALSSIEIACESRGFELKKVASGYRFQVRQAYSHWVSKLWEERPQRYSRALLETLALIAYRQPITRGDIEDIRGVAVSSNIIKTLVEREWVRVVGHRDVPGRPAMYATTKDFLDYFNVKALDELPPLSEIRDLEVISREVEARIEQNMQPKPETQLTEDVGGRDGVKVNNTESREETTIH